MESTEGQLNLEVKGKIPETRDPSADSEGHVRAWQANMEGAVRPRGWGEQGHKTRSDVAEVCKYITTPGRERAKWERREDDGKDPKRATSQ